MSLPFALLLILTLVVAAAIAIARQGRLHATANLRAEWGQPKLRERKMDAIAASHKSRVAEWGGAAALDDRTWNDLVLDDVFATIDRTESTLGQHALYHRLRTEHSAASLQAFEALVTRMENEPAVRERAQLALARLRDPQGYDLWWLARPKAIEAPAWYVLFPVLALVILGSLALMAGHPGLRVVLVGALFVNVVTYFATMKESNAAAAAFRQIAPLVATGQALQFLQGDDIDAIVGTLRKDTPGLRRLKTVSRWVSGDPLMLSVHPSPIAGMVADLFNVVYDYLNLLLPVNVSGMYFGAADLRAGGAPLLRVAAAVGDVDAAVSVAALRATLPTWTRPVFLPPGSAATIAEAVHPLVADAVPNSITLAAGRGVLVTGSNMSGKSTFLRTVGVSAVLAQTIHTCFARTYEAPLFRVRSCIGRSDDLLSGKSYYLVEVESLLGLVASSTDATRPHLFLLDELFRGTNTVERIAAGQAVLTEFIVGASGPTPHVVMAATHDTELVDLLEGAYVPCHFGDAMTDEGLTFDHRLRSGRSTSRNAIALLRLNGAPPALVERALALAETLDRQREGAGRSHIRQSRPEAPSSTPPPRTD